MRKLYILALLMAVSVTAMSQSQINVQVPNLVALDEQFNVTFIIEGEHAPSDFQWSPGSDFSLVWGPQKGSSTSISIVNGKRTRSSQTTYTYILRPLSVGKFQLEAASAVIGKEKVLSSRPSVEVVSGGSSSGGQASSPSASQAPKSSAQPSSEDIFLKMSFSKTHAVVGETITATLKLYQRVNLAGFENNARFPSFNGFWNQESAPSSIQFQRENVNDRIYESAVIRSWTLIPQRVGDLVVEPSELVAIINVRAPRTSTGSIFDSFFQDDYQQVRKQLATPSVTIHVSGLPSGAPSSFCGGVGSFRMNAALTRDSLKTHDAASLKVTVSGKGNLSMVSAPAVAFPPDFEVYDVKTTDASGSRTFEYPFIPRSYGDFEIGPVEFSYYDISAGKYITLASQPLALSVAKTDGPSAAASVESTQPGVIRKDVRDLGSDIRFIVTSPDSLGLSGRFFAGSLLFWILTVLMLVCSVAVWVVSRAVAARKADVLSTRERGATKMARRRLSQAGAYLKGNLYTAFYEELHRALLGYVSDKLIMDASEMTKENISSRLVEMSVPEGVAGSFVELLDACEFARYAPSAGNEAMNKHYENAVSVISEIDRCLKRRQPSSRQASAIAAIILLMSPAAVDAAVPASADSLWAAGTSAYADGYWREASDSWNRIIELGYESPDLYYNIGNAEFKANNLSAAILAYERALKVDPSHKDARFNLEYAASLCQDKIEPVPEFFIRTWVRRLCWMLSSDVWAILGLVFLAFTLALLLLFLLSSRRTARAAGFYSSIAAMLLCAVCLSFAFVQKSGYRSADSAIVTRAVASVKSAPGSSLSTDLFVLHEGTKVRILDEVGDWVKMELADGRQGWIKMNDIGVI